MRTISNSGGIWEKGILTKASFPQYVTRYNYRLENLIFPPCLHILPLIAESGCLKKQVFQQTKDLVLKRKRKKHCSWRRLHFTEYDGLGVNVLDSQSRGSCVQNQWVAPSSTQPFILPRSVK